MCVQGRRDQEILFGGTSAGGRGSMVLIDHLAALLHPGTSLWGLHDSGTIQIFKWQNKSRPCRQMGQCKKKRFCCGQEKRK
jgi:hypothetical protein